MPSVAGLGHVGIYTHDLSKMRDFYSRVMGLEITDEEIEERGIVFMSSKPEEEHHEFVLMKGRDVPEGSKMVQQISFYVNELSELKDFHQIFLDEKVRIERTVSHGNAFGMYALDPEGNTIEIYYRTGFPVPQPCADPVNLQDSEESLIAQAKSRIPA
ncbi:MAG: glyoxalase [Chloroflexi bacterium]|nr:glyoxalase [Chloroflexota bacterium]|tara:strand:- start:1064 stop:1537 length:474 start_codon:yes stop_codon:yes gene_type:complete